MEIFLHIDGQKIGPLNIYDVRDKLRRGDITPDTKAWVKGMEQWQPLRELGPLKESVEIHLADAGADEIRISEEDRRNLAQQVGASQIEKPRPWLRFWARFTDTPILLAPGILVMNYFMGPETLKSILIGIGPTPTFTNLAFFFSGMAISWVLTETLLFTFLHTTPGKWSLNITIQKDNGESLNFTEALRRSLVVFVFGMGLNYTFSKIICNIHAYFTLTNQGKTYWDKKQNLKVTHRPVSPLGIIITILILFASCMTLYQLLGKPEWLSAEQTLPVLTP